jgi:hypothetical protein
MATTDSSAPPRTTTDPNTRAGDPFAYAGDETPPRLHRRLGVLRL